MLMVYDSVGKALRPARKKMRMNFSVTSLTIFGSLRVSAMKLVLGCLSAFSVLQQGSTQTK
jgi:hypothetical protein